MIPETLQRTLVGIAQEQIRQCLVFRKPVITTIEKYLKAYNNNVERELKNRWNLPLPVIPGYIDTLMSKIDDPPQIDFEREEEADLKVAQKVTKVWEAESGPDKGNWSYVDRAVKKLAIFAGYGTYRYYAESEPKYASHLDAVDFYDYIFEPTGGGDNEKHLFNGQLNIFRSASQIKEGIKSKQYQNSGGSQLLTAMDGLENKEVTQDVIDEKNERYAVLGLESQFSTYVGESVTPLAEMCLTYQGTRYYLFFDYKSGHVLRADKLVDVFADDLYPYISWHTHEDIFNFTSKRTLDDIYPVSEGMRVIFNEAMNNLQKRNWGQRAYNTNVFKNPAQLKWKMGGLAGVNLPPGTDVRTAIMDLKTEDNTASVERLMTFLDSFLGQKTGITASAQGVSEDDKKVGVLYADLQQVADRLGLLNKSYKEAWARLGKRFVTGCKTHLNEEYAVKLIGLHGVEWDSLKGSEINNLNIKITGGNDEAQANEIKKAKQEKAIAQVIELGGGNTTAIKEVILKNADFDENTIKRLLESDMKGDDMIMSEAAQAMQVMVLNPKESLEQLMKRNDKGEAKLKVNSGATIGYMEKIIDFVEDNDLEPLVEDNMMAFQALHLPIVQRNMDRKATQIGLEQSLSGGAPMGQPGQPARPPSSPASDNMAAQTPGTPGATQSISQNTSNQLQTA